MSNKKDCYAYSETLGCRLENFNQKCQCNRQESTKSNEQALIRLTDEERLTKLDKAIAEIRNVEFSYPLGSPERQLLYKFVVDNFSLHGPFMGLYQELQDRVDGLTEEEK